MGKKRHKVESIVATLKESEVHSATDHQHTKLSIAIHFRLPMLDRITMSVLVHQLGQVKHKQREWRRRINRQVSDQELVGVAAVPLKGDPISTWIRNIER